MLGFYIGHCVRDAPHRLLSHSAAGREQMHHPNLTSLRLVSENMPKLCISVHPTSSAFASNCLPANSQYASTLFSTTPIHPVSALFGNEEQMETPRPSAILLPWRWQSSTDSQPSLYCGFLVCRAAPLVRFPRS